MTHPTSGEKAADNRQRVDTDLTIIQNNVVTLAARTNSSHRQVLAAIDRLGAQIAAITDMTAGDFSSAPLAGSNLMRPEDVAALLHTSAEEQAAILASTLKESIREATTSNRRRSLDEGDPDDGGLAVTKRARTGERDLPTAKLSPVGPAPIPSVTMPSSGWGPPAAPAIARGGDIPQAPMAPQGEMPGYLGTGNDSPPMAQAATSGYYSAGNGNSWGGNARGRGGSGMRGGASSHAPVNPHFASQGGQGPQAFVEFGPIVWGANPAQSFGHIINMLPSNGYGISCGTEHHRGHGDLENFIRVRFSSAGASYGFTACSVENVIKHVQPK
ncbi:hypothetical protein HWV62_17848 [Athelia sp. TMB]|nr:hypothetical protein HWV62_17848 [Athelia sp. TMB]